MAEFPLGICRPIAIVNRVHLYCLAASDERVSINPLPFCLICVQADPNEKGRRISR